MEMSAVGWKSAVLSGQDPATALVEAQLKVDTYLSCLTSISAETPDRYSNRVGQADPDFQAIQ
jgi:hypothetical protein